MARRKKRWPVILFSVLFFSVVSFFFWAFHRSENWQSDTGRWPAVEAGVIDGSVDQHTSDRTTSYRPVILYTYEVSGKRYQSDGYRYHDTLGSGAYDSSNRRSAKGIVDRYPPGSKTTAYYDPNDNSRSVLDNGPPDKSLWVTFFFALAWFGSLLVFCLGVRGTKVRPNP